MNVELITIGSELLLGFTVDTNAAVLGFWRRMGFEATGEARPYRYDHLESTTRLYERGDQPLTEADRDEPFDESHVNPPPARRA